MIHSDSDPAAPTSRSPEQRDEMIKNVLSCLLDHYLCSYDQSKDALAKCAMLLVPDWEARWEEFNPALALHDLQSLGDRDVEAERAGDSMNQTSEVPHD